MKLETAIKTLRKQADWLGISSQELLVDIEKYGRRLYPDLVVEAFNVYTIDQAVERELLCR